MSEGLAFAMTRDGHRSEAASKLWKISLSTGLWGTDGERLGMAGL